MGLRLKLFLPTLLGLLAFSVFIHFFWAVEQENEQIEAYKKTQSDFLQTIEPEISRALISNDIAALNAFLDEQMRIHHNSWRELTLTQADGNRLYPLFDYQEPNGKFIIILEHKIIEDYEDELGHLTLFLDWSDEHQRIISQTTKIEFILLALLAFIALTGSLLQSKIILSPLIKLKKAVNQFQTGDYDAELDTSRKDEIGELFVNFDLMRAQRRVNEESLRIAATAFDIHEGIVITDINKNILRVNNAFTIITGYSEEDVIGKQPSILKSGKHGKEFYRTLWSDINNHGKWNGEIWNKRKNGEIYPQYSSITAVKNTAGNTTHYVGSFLDISETKKYQSELKQKAKELEIALDKAEVASEAKSNFLATMSHEIRTPMNGVLGMTQLLAGTTLNSQQTEYLDIIKLSGQNLLTIINDILDFSKIEAKKMELEPIAFNLHDCSFEVTKLLSSKAREKELELLFNMSTDCPAYVVGDPGRIRQILLNIIGNAIKFTTHGHILLEILCSNKTSSSVDISFKISDTGIGIPTEHQEQLFHAFTQADSSTTRKFGGTGLGLSICRQLVALMGSEITVESELGKGSVFSFQITLPVTDSPEAIPMHNVEGINLLIVDDNKTNLRILEEQTQAEGIRTISAENSEQALEAIEQAKNLNNNFDAVILDYCMPGMDGAELGKQILSNPETKDLPLILLTSAGHSGDIKRFTELGFAGYLTKPAMSKTLLAMISASINTQRNKNQILTSHSVTEAPNNRHIGEVPAPQLSKARVLLAEDDVINQQVAIGMLNKISIKPDTAINGLEVLEKTQTNDYDLILMDCLMPKMDGFEATRLLRDNIKTRDVPVVALTANAQKVDRERCIECGMNDFLSKPFEFNDLENMLSRWLPESITDTDSPDQETTPENSMLMDFDIYEKLKSTIPDAFDNIINTFLHETTLRIEETIAHVEQNQFDAIILLTHSLKSSSAIVGAISLSNCAISMESAAKEHNKEAAAALAIELKEIFNDLQQTIDSYRATST